MDCGTTSTAQTLLPSRAGRKVEAMTHRESGGKGWQLGRWVTARRFLVISPTIAHWTSKKARKNNSLCGAMGPISFGTWQSASSRWFSVTASVASEQTPSRNFEGHWQSLTFQSTMSLLKTPDSDVRLEDKGKSQILPTPSGAGQLLPICSHGHFSASAPSLTSRTPCCPLSNDCASVMG